VADALDSRRVLFAKTDSRHVRGCREDCSKGGKSHRRLILYASSLLLRTLLSLQALYSSCMCSQGRLFNAKTMHRKAQFRQPPIWTSPGCPSPQLSAIFVQSTALLCMSKTTSCNTVSSRPGRPMRCKSRTVRSSFAF
jgi:hypothetical protein